MKDYLVKFLRRHNVTAKRQNIHSTNLDRNLISQLFDNGLSFEEIVSVDMNHENMIQV